MIEAIEYWTNESVDTFPTRLMVARRGTAELEIASKEGDPIDPNIGQFSMATDGDAFERLSKAVSAAEFLQHANPGPANPGEVIRQITVRFDDAHEVQRHVKWSVPADPGFKLAEQEALRIIAETRRHPKHAMAIEMKVSPGATREDLVLAVTLINVGKETVALPHPSRWADMGMALHVTARRSDVPLAQMSNEHQTLVELGQGALASAPTPMVPRITLAPGQKQLFSFNARLPLSAGKYEIWGAMILQSLNEQGEALLVGELVSPKTPLAR